jgi:hypothetical protein
MKVHTSRFFIRVIVSQLDELVLGEDNVGCLGYVLELELLLEDQVELELDLRELKCRQGPDGQLLVIHLHENMVALLSLASTTAPYREKQGISMSRYHKAQSKYMHIACLKSKVWTYS